MARSCRAISAHPIAPTRSTSAIAEVASRHLVRLSEQVAWPSVIAVPRLDHVEIVETNSTLLRLDAITLGPVGSRLSYIHTSTGRAYLAFCDAGEREAIIDRLRPADDDGSGRTLLDEALAETRERGYALREPFHPWPDRDWQAVRQDGRRSIAVPVMLRGKPVASLNVTWLVRRTDSDTVVNRHLNGAQAHGRDGVGRAGRGIRGRLSAFSADETVRPCCARMAAARRFPSLNSGKDSLMRAWQIAVGTTSLDGLSLVDLPTPEAGPGQVAIRVHACSLNYRDQAIVKGVYWAAPWRRRPFRFPTAWAR